MKNTNELVTKALGSVVNPPPVKTKTKDCSMCFKPFEAPDNVMSNYLKLCPGCSKERDEKIRQEEVERESQRRLRRWIETCPKEYLSIRQELLPTPSKLDETLAWSYGPKGIVMHGSTGNGKTRCAWALLRRECVSHGRTVSFLDSMGGLRYASLYSKGADIVEEWVHGLIAVDILLLDDVFKNKLTDSFEGVIFTLVDQRIQNQRPTILTSNDTGQTLTTRMTLDRGEPLLRRLREYCVTIHF
jgi:DNA replication protein DnaC